MFGQESNRCGLPSGNNESMARVEVLNVPDKIYRNINPEIERRLLQHDLMLDECTLKGKDSDDHRLLPVLGGPFHWYDLS